MCVWIPVQEPSKNTCSANTDAILKVRYNWMIGQNQ